MKRMFIVIGAVFLVCILIKSRMNPEKETKSSNENTSGLPREYVAVKIKSSEPKVLDAVFTDANVLYVGVKDDGTDRSAYAEYICEAAKDFSKEVTMVKVVKYNSMNDPNRDNSYGVLLGKAYCK